MRSSVSTSPAADLLKGRKTIKLVELKKLLPEKEWKRLLGRGAPKGRGNCNNQPTQRHGILFDSRWEADCYDDLLKRQRAGEIYDLKRQQELEVIVNEQWVTTWTIDFTWRDSRTGALCYGEAKSEWTAKIRDYPLRRRLVEAQMKIKVVEFIQPSRERRADPRPKKTKKGRK